jgi:nicotinamidase-related amidase
MARDDTTGRRGDARFPLQNRPGDAMLSNDDLNDLEIPCAEKILPWALKLAKRLAAFRAAAHRHGLPVIYANDNFGFWHSSTAEVYAHATHPAARGREVGRKLKPGRGDYFILKPRHSAFFATSLIPLLEFLQVKRLILAGIATNLCVLFTAHDAHMHGYPMLVLSDCCAAESDFDHNFALGQLQRFCAARVCLSTEFNWTTRRAK